MSKLNRITGDRAEELLRTTDLTQNAIALKTELTQAEVSFIARRHGILTRRGRRLAPEKVERIRHLLETGWTQAEIAIKAKAGIQTVNSIAKGIYDPSWSLRHITDWDIATEMKERPERTKQAAKAAFGAPDLLKVAKETGIPLNLLNAVREDPRIQSIWDKWREKD